MTHGGARKGAGRPKTPINEARLNLLLDQKLPMHEIAIRFGVAKHVIAYHSEKRKLRKVELVGDVHS